MMLIEFTQFETADGLIYYFDDRYSCIMSEDGYGMPSIEYITQQGPFEHGRTVIDYRLQPRIVQIVQRTDDCDRYGYWDRRSELINYLRPNRGATFMEVGEGILTKVLPNGYRRSLSVVSDPGPNFPFVTGHWDMHGFTNALRFIAHDPTFYDPDVNQLTWNFSPTYTELVFPITFPIEFGSAASANTQTATYPGTWLSLPTIYVHGPIEGFSLTNLITGDMIRLNYFVSAGEIVTISLRFGNKRIYNNFGTNLFGTLDARYSSSLTRFGVMPDPIAPGGVNQFYVAGTNLAPATSSVDLGSMVIMEYYDRYIAI